MRSILFGFILVSAVCHGQELRKDLASSRLFVTGVYENETNTYTSVAIKEVEKDTLISGKEFKKVLWQLSKDLSKERRTEVQYESFSNNTYTLLDAQLQKVHNLSFNSKENQRGTLFGKEGSIGMEYIDTRNYFPKDSLIPDQSTPRKYFLAEAPSRYIIIRPDLKIVEIANNGTVYTKQLVGDLFTRISNNLKVATNIMVKPSINTGDEIQLFYRRKWYNDTTGAAEYEDKQFKNIKYVSDTIVDGKRNMKFKMNGYNFLSGNEEEESEYLATVTDSGIYVGQQFIAFREYKPEFKIVNEGNESYFFVQGFDYQKVGSSSFPVVIQYYSNSPYRYFLLSYFPMPFIEFGNVEGLIPYARIKGVENGARKEKVLRTDATHIRSIRALSAKAVAVTLFVKSSADFDFTVEGSKSVKQTLEAGERTVTLPANLQKGKGYSIQINYKSSESNGSSGSMSSGFIAQF